MSRLKTFLTYVLIIVTFFIVSSFLESGLIKKMYYNMDGTANSNLDYYGKNINMDVDIVEAKSTNMNGYIRLKITNNSSTLIEKAYIKVLLYTKSDVLAATKYMRIENLEAGETREYKLKFNGHYIKRYIVTVEKEFPNEDKIFNFFGYEIDMSNVFGLDLSNIITARSIGEFTGNVFHSVKVTVKSIPWWGWFFAFTIVAGIW